MQACGASIDWAASIFANGSYNDFFEQADASKDAPVYLPFIRGLQENRHMLGTFTELRDNHESSDFCMAVLEGLCFEQKRSIAALEESICVVGDQMHLRAVGRLSFNPLLMQIKANVLNRIVEPIAHEHAVCLGAAYLAANLCGEKIEIQKLIDNTYQPNARDVEKYAKRYETYLCSFSKMNQY